MTDAVPRKKMFCVEDLRFMQLQKKWTVKRHRRWWIAQNSIAGQHHKKAMWSAWGTHGAVEKFGLHWMHATALLSNAELQNFSTPRQRFFVRQPGSLLFAVFIKPLLTTLWKPSLGLGVEANDIRNCMHGTAWFDCVECAMCPRSENPLHFSYFPLVKSEAEKSSQLQVNKNWFSIMELKCCYRLGSLLRSHAERCGWENSFLSLSNLDDEKCNWNSTQKMVVTSSTVLYFCGRSFATRKLVL